METLTLLALSRVQARQESKGTKANSRMALQEQPARVMDLPQHFMPIALLARMLNREKTVSLHVAAKRMTGKIDRLGKKAGRGVNAAGLFIANDLLRNTIYLMCVLSFWVVKVINSIPQVHL